MIQTQAAPETKIRLCGPCERDGDSEVAKHWCCQCEDAFCDTCLKYHGRKKKNKAHKILPIEDMEQVSSNVSAVDGCMDHEGQDLAYYCNTHERLCCKFCLFSTHNECKTHTFDEMASIDPSLFDVEKMLVGLNDLDDRANLAMIFHRNQKEALDTSRANVKDKVSKLVTTAKSKLEECQNRFECILDKMQHRKDQRVNRN
ncbi:hypothetical protein KUTeg_021333 [Tegillarca granosa]|uniref:B box-type domain-containing protein n=1 Tax=Tegillarca granosa TaxID=220873 RepID=A0ABQ9EAH1_TEGGR|nr:hypothetical protein KUTeg_021333 [Tegillarca granosa]